MTPLKPSEKRLLIILGIAAFLLFNLLGFSWWKKSNLVLERKRITLETRARELEFAKTLAPEAGQKRSFLDAHLEPYPDEASREIYLDKFIKQVASDLNLEVRKNQTLPVKLEEHFHKSRYTADVIGAWDDVFAFIFKMQSPKAFRFVSTLRLKSQKKEGATDDAAEVVCTFEVERWWSPDSVAPEELLKVDPPVPATTAETPADSPATPPVPGAPTPEAPAAPLGDPAAPQKTVATEQSNPEAVQIP